MQSGSIIGKKILNGCIDFFRRLIKRKKMDDLQKEIETESGLKKRLNWLDLTALGLGSIIGSGIFVLSGQAAARYAGPSVIISFILTGIVALLAGLSFSELATMMSSSGAAYSYTYAALGEYAAWFIGWNYALLCQLSASAVVVGWTDSIVQLIDHISDYNVTSKVVQAPVAWDESTLSFYSTGEVINIPAIAITIAITIILIIGIRETAIVTLVLTIIKIVILLIFIFACCKYVNIDNYTPFFPPNQGSFSKYGVTGMFQACTYVFFAYLGFETIATAAQETKPKQTYAVPIAIIGSIVISLLLYVGICTVMVGLVPYNMLDSNSPLSEAIKATKYGQWLLILMDIGAIISLGTVALTTLLSQIRIFYAMACDGLLPTVFAKLHPKTSTPMISTIISGTFCAVISGVCPIDLVGDTSTITALITYLFVHIEVIVLRLKPPNVDPNFRVPFGNYLIPIVGSILCILLMTGVSKGTGYRFLIWTVIGQIIYFAYGFWHSKLRKSSARQSMSGRQSLVSTVESYAMGTMPAASEPDVTDEPIKTRIDTEEDVVANF